MQKTVLILGAGSLLAYATYLTTQQGQVIDLTQPDSTNEDSTFSSITTFLGGITMGSYNLSRARLVTADMLNITNVKAFLAMIRAGEGTSDAAGYKRMFTGAMFSDYSKHPNIKHSANGFTSTAAGAYQFVIKTWLAVAKEMGLKDFSPRNQDLAALGLIATRGALDDVIQGRLKAAIIKLKDEWASLPSSTAGQPTRNWTQATNTYLANNGTISQA